MMMVQFLTLGTKLVNDLPAYFSDPALQPTPMNVIQAADRLAGHVRRTPLIQSKELGDLVGGTVLLKLETLQITSSFKIRGAFNRLLMMAADDRPSRIVAWSAGNHGRAVAYVGKQLGIPVTILMPQGAAATKIASTKQLGAEVIFYDRDRDSREDMAAHISAQTGALIVPPFNDPAIIAGAGTTALEIIDDAHARGLAIDRLVVSVGGGGLIAGCGLAALARDVSPKIFAAEPKGYDDTVRSLALGSRVANDGYMPTLADALTTPIPGEMTFAVNRELVKGGFVVTNNDLATAIRFAFEELRIVTEAGGAAALAALIANPAAFRDQTTAVILSGGNIDVDILFPLLLAARDDDRLEL